MSAENRSRPATTPSGSEKVLADLESVYPKAGLEQAIEIAERDWWSQGAALAIRQLAMSGRGFTSEHLVDLCGMPNESCLVGAAFAAAQRTGAITTVGAVIGRDGVARRVWWATS